MAGEPTPAASLALPLLAGVALLFGLYGRFKGLGTWPLGVDEFYLSRSVDNILHSGLPAFPCGGFYTRGLIYQYAVAGLRLAGWTPEFAGRWAAAAASLTLLPAAFLLGRKVEGSSTGWVMVILLCVSVWEIEMARFARMYAPFQAAFAWYLLAYLRFTATREAGALAALFALSVLGVLLWEGGVLLGLANGFAILMAAQGRRLEARDWRRLAVAAVLMGVLYLATKDLRGFTDPPDAPPDADPPLSAVALLASWFAPLVRHPVAAAALLLPLAASLPALRWAASFRGRPSAAVGLCLVLLAAAAHALLVAASLLVLLRLLRLIDARDLENRRAAWFWVALGGYLLVWVAISAAAGGLSGHRLADGTSHPGDLEVIRLLWGLPDVSDQVIRPWLRTVPLLTCGLLAGVAYAGWEALSARRAGSEARAALVGVLIVLLLAVGAVPTDRIETRYTFFLYPLMLLLATTAVIHLARRSALLRRLPPAAAAAVPLLCFGASGDFQPGHVIAIDSARVNYRTGLPAHLAEHYYPRNDIRGVADYLAAHVHAGDVVITGIPSLDEYYRPIDYFFLADGDERYETFVCQDGRTERWTNRPVLYTAAALRPIVAGHRVFASVFADTERRLAADGPAQGWSVNRVWRADSGTADVILIQAAPAAGGLP